MRSSLLSSLLYPAHSLSLSLSRYPLSPFSLFQHLYNAPSLSYRQLSISVVYVPIAMQLFLSFSPVSLLARTSFSLPLSIPQIYRTQNTQFSLSFFLYPSRFLSLKSVSHAELPPPITPTSFDRFELTVSFLLEIQNCSISHMYMCVYIYIYIFIYTHNLSSPPLPLSFSLILFLSCPFRAFGYSISVQCNYTPAGFLFRTQFDRLFLSSSDPTPFLSPLSLFCARAPHDSHEEARSIAPRAERLFRYFRFSHESRVDRFGVLFRGAFFRRPFSIRSGPWRTVSLTGAVQCHK